MKATYVLFPALALLLGGCATALMSSEEDAGIGTPSLEKSLAAERSVTPVNPTTLVAMNGYDPVQMLETGREKVRGSPEHAMAIPIPERDQSVTYWFRSTENLQKFRSNPHKYRPKYGGFCGWGVVDYRNTESKRQLNISHATPVPPAEQGGVYVVRDAGSEDARIVGFYNDTVRDWFMTAPDFYERIADRQWQRNRNDVLVPWNAVADTVRALRYEQQEVESISKLP